jgi:hypothetical protein
LYGKNFHTAAENFMRDGVELPPEFSFTKPHLSALRSLPGTKYCEYEMGLTKELSPCGFRDSTVWCRGIADLLIINEEKGIARVVDYKTSKSTKYADTAQLELMALMIFKHFPFVRKVRAGLLFVVANNFKPADYDVRRLEVAHNLGVWNPSPSGLCKRHCIVTTCPHNGANGG